MSRYSEHAWLHKRRRKRLAAEAAAVNTVAPSITADNFNVSTVATINLGSWTGADSLSAELRHVDTQAVIATYTEDGNYTFASTDSSHELGLYVVAQPGDVSAESTAVGPVADQEMAFQVTTTGAAQTLTLNEIRTAIGETIDIHWGDGSNNNYSSTGSTGNQRTHQYASAGAYTVTIDRPDRVTHFDVRDTKISQLLGAQLCKMVNLLNFRVLTVPATALQWTVGPSAPMFPNAQYIQIELQDNFVWTVSGDMPPINDVLNLRGLPGLTWAINATNPIPVLTESLTIRDCGSVTYVSSAENVPDLSVVRIEDGWSQTEVDAFLRDVYAAFPTRTPVGGTIDLLGSSNAAPSGVLAAMCPPTTGKARAFELVNDSCGVSPNHWTTVMTA